MKLVLATGSDAGYYEKIQPYLNSIEANSTFDENQLVYLGDEEIEFEYDNIKLSRLNREDCKFINVNNCVQHGEFLHAENIKDLSGDDIICFTDGDIILQRGLSKKERKQLENLKDGDVMAGYNASPSDTLYDEAMRLDYTGKIVDGLTNIDLRQIMVYNTGVLIMNKNTWQSVYDQYNELWPDVEDMFEHYAKQQWLLSFVINTKGYNPIIIGYDMHSHGHYGTPFWVYYDMRDKSIPNGYAMTKDKKILFRHKL